jgi:hypothetical protein
MGGRGSAGGRRVITTQPQKRRGGKNKGTTKGEPGTPRGDAPPLPLRQRQQT